jgi:signal transduction histidine kinase
LRSCIFSIIILLTVNLTVAQTTVESLENQLINTKGTARLDLLLKVGEKLWENAPKKSLLYGEEALLLARASGNKVLEAKALGVIAGGYYYLGSFDKSLKYQLECLDIRRLQCTPDAKDSIYINLATTLGNIGSIYITIGDLTKALDYSYEALRISEKLQDTLGIGFNYNALAHIYSNLKQHKKSLDYYRKSLKYISLSGKKKYLPSVLNGIAGVYNHLEKYDSALYYYTIQTQITRQMEQNYVLVFSLSNTAEIFIALEQFDSARVKLDEAYSIAISNSYLNPLTNVYITYGYLYLKTGELQKAMKYAMEGKKITRQINNRKRLLDYYDLIAELYTKLNQPSKANQYLKEYSALKDSLYTQDINEKISDIEVRLATTRVEAEVEKLKTEKELKELEAEKSKNIRTFLIILSALIFLVSVLIYSRYELKRKSAKMLAEKNEELELSNTTKDKFFAIISHDLKNHLLAFQTITHVLANNFSELTDEKRKHLITRINYSSSSLYHLLENLLDWSMAQIKGFDCQPSPLHLSETIDRITDEVKLMAEKKNITIHNLIPTKQLIMADLDQFSTIIRNLLNNAIKFSNEGKEVYVEAKTEGEFIKISVKDSGIGILEEDQTKLFRLDVDHKSIGLSREKGSGLGLILCKEFVEKNGGRIWVESIYGSGSIFHILLPSVNSSIS